MTAVSFRVLGPLEAVRAGLAVPLGGPRPRAVLAALLLAAGRPVRLDTLVDAVWGDTPPGTAVKTVQKYVSHLRAQLGDGVITSRPAGYQLVAGDLDSRRFAELVAEPGAEPGRAEAALTEALGLWRGDPYGDLPDFAAAQAERRRLAELRMSAVEALAETRLGLGRHGPLVGWLEQLVAEHPLRERLWGVLMLALYRSGRQAEALGAYQRLRTALAEELGAEPTPALRALHERLLRQDDRAARTFPLRLTSFVGRVAELGELTALLAGHRLVTLTGAAGSGKTRLAVEAAATGSAEAWLVELAGVTDPRRVPPAVASVLRVGEQPGRDVREVLADALAERSLLLVLDNCEHLLDATAELVTELLRAAPRVRVLATSRQPLGVAGEQVVDVPPLPVPATDDPAEVAAADAVRLLTHRARAADSRFALTAANTAAVARIARRLDGMPLALELAAARLRVFDAGQLAGLLDDRFAVLVSTRHGAPARHQTLRAAIAWSYDLLTADEQALFRALSVFEGGFPLAAAERVLDRPGGALTLLPALVERSLVVAGHRSGETRYGMLETLREYGRAQLDPDEARRCHQRHLAYHLDLAERLGAGVRGPHRPSCLARLDAERDNLRAALRWSLTHGEHLAALRLAASLALYWDEQAQYGEGGGWLREAVAAAPDAPPALLAAALAGAAQLAISLGEHERAAGLARRGLDVARAAGDETGVARATTQLGNLALYQGDYAGAERHLTAGLAAYVRLGLLWERAEVLGRLGHLHRLRGQHETARERLEQSLVLRDQAGDRAGSAWTLWQLGVLARYQGEHSHATARYEESLAHFDALGDVGGAAHVRYSMADVARLRHDGALAASLYTESLDRLREQGDQRCVASILCNLGALALDRADPAAATPLYAQSLTLRRRLHDQAGVAECLEGFAAVRQAHGDATAAVRLLGAATALRTRTGASRPASDDGQHAARVEALRAAAGPPAFDAAWAAGHAADGETLAAEVLADAHRTGA